MICLFNGLAVVKALLENGKGDPSAQINLALRLARANDNDGVV